MILLRLFWEFFKTGLFSVGGGLATLPFLYDMGSRTGWFTAQNVADMLAVSESTPGPIGVNMATYVGYSVGGIPGAVTATLGLVTPSVIVIVLVAAFLDRFGDRPVVRGVMYGLRPASEGLVAAAGLTVAAGVLLVTQADGSVSGIRPEALLLGAVIAAATHIKVLKKLHPVVWIALSAVVGIVFRFAGV